MAASAMDASNNRRLSSRSSDGVRFSVLCRYFASGACRNGADCRFSHNRNDPLDNVCRYFMQGSCAYGSRCRFDHVRSRTPDESSSKKPVLPPPVAETKEIQLKSNLRAEAKEFIPSSSSSLLSVAQDFDEIVTSELTEDPTQEAGTYASVVKGSEGSSVSLLCEYYVRGQCFFGDNCSFLHGRVCDMCFLPILHPTDPQQNAEHKRECLLEHEKDMEASFAVARSEVMQCGICMEVVLEKKQAAARRFGILEKCKHCFCIECIRKWRGQNRSFENQIISVWVEDEAEKKKLIDEYLKSMKAKPCKYFKEGRSECPFGNKCFYKHAKPDGTLVEGESPRTIRRRLRAQRRERNRNWIDDYFLVEFLERRGLADSSDEESDFGVDFDISMDMWEAGGWSDSDISSESNGDGEGWLLRALQDELRELTFTGAAVAAASRQGPTGSAAEGGSASGSSGTNRGRGNGVPRRGGGNRNRRQTGRNRDQRGNRIEMGRSDL